MKRMHGDIKSFYYTLDKIVIPWNIICEGFHQRKRAGGADVAKLCSSAGRGRYENDNFRG